MKSRLSKQTVPPRLSGIAEQGSTYSIQTSHPRRPRRCVATSELHDRVDIWLRSTKRPTTLGTLSPNTIYPGQKLDEV